MDKMQSDEHYANAQKKKESSIPINSAATLSISLHMRNGCSHPSRANQTHLHFPPASPAYLSSSTRYHTHFALDASFELRHEAYQKCHPGQCNAHSPRGSQTRQVR